MLLQFINWTIASRPQLFKVHLLVFKRRDELSGIPGCYTFYFKWIFVGKIPFGYFKEFKVPGKIYFICKSLKFWIFCLHFQHLSHLPLLINLSPSSEYFSNDHFRALKPIIPQPFHPNTINFSLWSIKKCICVLYNSV